MLTDSAVTRSTTPTALDDTQYTYDPDGNITSQTETRQATSHETQCYTYDPLDRLTQAWTATDACAAAPLTLNNTAQTPTWRQFSPYGAPRGTTPVSWPDQNGFLGDPADSVDGLTAIGGRQFDPTTGQ